jgi:hypothetical protein
VEIRTLDLGIIGTSQDHRQADLITRNTAISAAPWQLATQLLEADPSGVPDAISFNTVP